MGQLQRGDMFNRFLVLGLICCCLSGCVSLRGEEPVQVERPEASADYDFLVARSLEQEGQLDQALEAYQRAASKDPEAAFIYTKLAELWVQKGDYEAGLRNAEIAYELDPSNSDIRLFLGTLYRIRRDAVAAQQVLLNPQTQSPTDYEAGLLLFTILLESDQYEQALELANWAIDAQPENLRGYLALAAALEKLDRPAALEEALRKALEREPNNLTIYNALARARHERGDREGEVAIYREILQRYPHHQGTLFALAEALIRENQLDEAQRTLREIEEHYPDDARATIRLGLLAFQQENYESARSAFVRALRLEPDEYELAYFLGLSEERTKRFDKAIASLESVPVDHPRYVDARTQLAMIYEEQRDFTRALEEIEQARGQRTTRALDLYYARLLGKTEDADAAVQFLNGLLEKDPDDDELLFTLGAIYGEAHQYDEALIYMHKALAANPDNANALNYVGYTWAERGENLDQAEAMIIRALELRPDDGYITDSLGWLYYMRAQPLLQGGDTRAAKDLLQQALRELKRANQLTGGDPIITEHLGDVYLQLDERRKAFERYREALGQEPRLDEQPELQQKYERLRDEFGEP